MTGPYERRAFPLTLRSDGGQPTRIVGHAAIFDSDSAEMGFFTPFRERIARGAFDGALDRVRSGADVVYALLNHDENYIIASTADKTLDLSTDEIGLVASMEPMDTQTIRDLVVTPMQQGKLRKMSFGFTVAEEHPDKLNGMNYRIIDKVGQLFDVSPVVFPAYPGTDVQSREIYRALGLNPAVLNMRQVASLRAFVEAFGIEIRATWDAAYINDLPDSAFAYIEGGGEKDDGGKTTPRSLRHFPHHDSSGSPDADHVRNALSRIPQSSVSASAKAEATAHVERHAKALGIGQPETNSHLQKFLAAGRKDAPVAIAPVLPAGAGMARLRDLELRDHESYFYAQRRTK